MQLEQQLVAAAPQDKGNNGEVVEVVEKPSGSGWSIQQAMGLNGRGRKYDDYKAIQVCGHQHVKYNNAHLTHLLSHSATSATLPWPHASTGSCRGVKSRQVRKLCYLMWSVSHCSNNEHN